MFLIEQSAFLNALGMAIGSSLWQLAALWLIYTATTGIFTLTPARRYQFAVVASMVGFISFISSFLYLLGTAALPVETRVYIFTEPNENLNRSSSVNQLLYIYHSVLASLRSLSPYISCGYLLVFLTLGIRLVNGFRQVNFFATKGLGKVDVQWRLFVKENAQILQISREVRVFTSKYIQSPLTMGFWKPIILLPVANLNSLTTGQVEAILLHELAHIHRHDYLVNIFVQIAETSLFFNPFMRLLLKQVRLERENCCDDYVLQFQYSAKDYAMALLAIEKNNSATLLALSLKDTQSFHLLNRVKRMVAPEPHSFNYRQQLSMLLLLTVLGVGFTVIIPKPKMQSPVNASPAKINVWHEQSRVPAVNTSTPVVPGQHAFNLVKLIQGIENNPEDPATQQMIEDEASALSEEAKILGDAEVERVERSLSPYVKSQIKWAEAFSDNSSEVLEKLEEAASKTFDPEQFSDRLEQLAHMNIGEDITQHVFKTMDFPVAAPFLNLYAPFAKSLEPMPFKLMPFNRTNTTPPSKEKSSSRKVKDVQNSTDDLKLEFKIEQEIKAAVGKAIERVKDQEFQIAINLKTGPVADHQLQNHNIQENRGNNNGWMAKPAVIEYQGFSPLSIKDTDDDYEDQDNNKEDGADLELKIALNKLKQKLYNYSVALPGISINKHAAVQDKTGTSPKGCKDKATNKLAECPGSAIPDASDSKAAPYENLNFDIHKETRVKNGREQNVMVITIITSESR